MEKPKMTFLRKLFGTMGSDNEQSTGKKCKVCGQTNSPDAKFCLFCRNEFPVIRDRFDAFISYRRETGSDLASLLQIQLENSFHKQIFLDVKELQVGNFDEALLHRIEETPNFILILSKSSLDRCEDKSDWLKREIMHAIKTGRNIIPVLTDVFTFPSDELWAKLPQGMRILESINGIKYSHIYQDSAIGKIASYMKTEVEKPLTPQNFDLEIKQPQIPKDEPPTSGDGNRIAPQEPNKPVIEGKGDDVIHSLPIVVISKTNAKKDSLIIFSTNSSMYIPEFFSFRPRLGESKLELLEVVPATSGNKHQPAIGSASIHIVGPTQLSTSADQRPFFGSVSINF
jgi:hypothetical protein